MGDQQLRDQVGAQVALGPDGLQILDGDFRAGVGYSAALQAVAEDDPGGDVERVGLGHEMAAVEARLSWKWDHLGPVVVPHPNT